MPQKPASLPRIVLDVNIAVWGSHPSGDSETDASYTPVEVCLTCKQTMKLLRSLDYLLRLSVELNNEWNSVLFKRQVVSRKPSSRREISELEYACEQYARTWFTSMTSTGRVDVFDANQAHTRLPLGALSDAQIKDAHLVESALGSDRRIVSHDKKVREAWIQLLKQPAGKELVRSFSKLPRLVWVDPELHKDLCYWLENDAPDKPSYRLENGPSS